MQKSLSSEILELCWSFFDLLLRLVYAMTKTPLSFLLQLDGSPVMAPAGTERVVIMGYTPHKAGPPKYLYRENNERFSVGPNDPPSALGVLESGHYRAAFFDRNNTRIGKDSYPFEIQHLDKKPEQRELAHEPLPEQHPQTQRLLDRYEAMAQKLLGLTEKLVSHVVELSKKTLDTQVAVVAVTPKTIEATSKVLGASIKGGELSETVNAIEHLKDAVSSDGSNIEAVLNSPVVIGAAAALQKYVAKAAENGAEAMAKDDGHENMAERAARLAAKANDRAARKAVARS